MSRSSQNGPQRNVEQVREAVSASGKRGGNAIEIRSWFAKNDAQLFRLGALHCDGEDVIPTQHILTSQTLIQCKFYFQRSFIWKRKLQGGS